MIFYSLIFVPGPQLFREADGEATMNLVPVRTAMISRSSEDLSDRHGCEFVVRMIEPLPPVIASISGHGFAMHFKDTLHALKYIHRKTKIGDVFSIYVRIRMSCNRMPMYVVCILCCSFLNLIIGLPLFFC